MKTLLFTLFLCLLLNQLTAQNKSFKDYTKEEVMQMTTEDLLDLPLEDLMTLANKLGISIDDFLEMKTGVSSKKELSPRESPSILSIITEEQITASGARDLLDVLNLVPGYAFARDVDAVVGAINRGIWGNEGKILLLIDGQEMNDIFYGSLQFGNHYNIHNIKKIEIIRGAGSSIYGGYAELGVINIITKQGKDYKGACAMVNYGQMGTLNSRKTVDFEAGNVINDLDFYVAGNYTTGNNATGTVKNFLDSTYKLNDGYSKFTSVSLNGGFNYKNLKTRLLYNDYIPYTVDYNRPISYRFQVASASTSYDFKLNEKLHLTPTLSLNWQRPWETHDADGYDYQRTATRSKAQVDVQYDINTNINLSGGTQFYYDYAWLQKPDTLTFYNGKQNISFNNLSFYAQSLIKTKWLNFVLGLRNDYHSQGGNAFSPRIALTKVLDKFHYKILYSGAFRSPSIDNYDINPHLVPEKTTVIELETGYKINQFMFATINFFDITIKKPIVYYYDYNLVQDYYENFSKVGSRGFEIEYIWRNSIIDARINYSYYTAAGKNTVERYSVITDGGNTLKDKYIAAPNHKISLYTNFSFGHSLTICPTFTFFGEKYAYTTATVSESGEIIPILNKIEPLYLLNCNINYKIKGFTIGFSTYNILNQQYGYPQAYNGQVCPYPAPSREFILSLKYTIND